MIRRILVTLAAATAIFAAGTAGAAELASNPISHGSGFSSVVCNLVNAGKKPLVVESFWMKQLVASPSYAVQSQGCTGVGPYTIQPGAGCTRRIFDPTICNQPDACFCYATISGSTKLVRASIIGTVSGSTATVTSELRAK